MLDHAQVNYYWSEYSSIFINDQVIHELLCHPDIDIMAVDSDGATAEKLACAHIKNILLTFK